MWTCVEEREDSPHGRMMRKVLFTDLYENEEYASQNIAIPKEIELKVWPRLVVLQLDYLPVQVWQESLLHWEEQGAKRFRPLFF